MTYVDAVLAAYRVALKQAEGILASEGRSLDVSKARPRASHAVAALLMEAAGVGPSAIKTGIIVVVAAMPALLAAVQDMLCSVHVGDILAPRSFERPSRENVVLVDDDDLETLDEWLPGASEHAGGVVHLTGRLPAENGRLAALVEATFLLPPMSSVPSLLPRVVELVTGERPDDDMQDLTEASLAQISMSIRPSMTATVAVARLRALMSTDRALADAQTRQEQADLDGSGDDQDVHFPCDTTAAPVERGILKLSRMQGFGAAAEWGMRLAADLAAYKAGTLAWCDVDRGILLSGAPGSGKTSFAKALALECEVPFYPTSFSTLVGGSSTGYTVEKELRKFFEKARSTAPCIVFLDEMDSVPGRDFKPDHNSSFFNSVNNAFLEQLDGAEPRPGVVVIAATNYPERVDLALRRPGRLDRHVEIPLPGTEVLGGIIRHHLGLDSLVTDDALRDAARACRGKTPADIEQICRDARRIARRAKVIVTAGHVVEALDVRRLEHARPAASDRRTAIHEAAHATVALALSLPLEWVDLDKGLTRFSRAELPLLEDVLREITMALAARAAEEVIFGEASTGCQVDLEQATKMAADLHTRLGLGLGGLISFDAGQLRTDEGLFEAVRGTLDGCYTRAVSLVSQKRDSIERIASGLLQHRHMDAGDIRALYGDSPADQSSAKPQHIAG